jgi:hypothetical protein
VSSVRSWPDQASARAFAGAGLRASTLPNCFAVMVRLTEAGIQAFMIRLSRPGMILERFTRNAFRSSDTHCSTLRGFIGMVRGSNPATERQGNPPDQFAGESRDNGNSAQHPPIMPDSRNRTPSGPTDRIFADHNVARRFSNVRRGIGTSRSTHADIVTCWHAR